MRDSVAASVTWGQVLLAKTGDGTSIRSYQIKESLEDVLCSWGQGHQGIEHSMVVRWGHQKEMLPVPVRFPSLLRVRV